MLTATVIVATHKKYKMPKDPLYMPMLVGAAGSDVDCNYVKDDFINIEECDDKGLSCKRRVEGGISEKNGTFCELTGLYAAWKNINSDYVGLVHYRRHFLSPRYKGFLNKRGLKTKKEKFDSLFKESELRKYLPDIKVFVPEKRNYYIETLYSHYGHTHYIKHLDMTRSIIKKMYPKYISSFDRVMVQKSGYMFNMMIMRKDLLNNYCTWLFNILFKLEEEIDKDGCDFSKYQGRIYGRISELLFNVWIDRMFRCGKLRMDEIMELPYIHMEKIDMKRKALSFIKAKLFNKKYESSF